VIPGQIAAQLDRLVAGLREVLGERLVAVYLHGSLALGGFQPGRSDIDVLVVVREPQSDGARRWRCASSCCGCPPTRHPSRSASCRSPNSRRGAIAVRTTSITPKTGASARLPAAGSIPISPERAVSESLDRFADFARRELALRGARQLATAAGDS
jgi:hypothetical protein